MNSESTHVLKFMNNGKTFPSLGGMSYHYTKQLQLLLVHWEGKKYQISCDLQKFDLSENNASNIRNDMKSQIKNKMTGSISYWNY